MFLIKMEYSLSGQDIKDLLDGNVKIITYRKLSSYGRLSDLFKEYGCVILLFETQQNVGHWTLIISLPNRYEFFDSYGVKPDDELNFIDKEFRINSNQEYPKLLELFYHSNKPVHYNQYQFQKMSPGVNTCGRWCVVRAKTYSKSADGFKKWVDRKRKGKAYDKWVVEFTNQMM